MNIVITGASSGIGFHTAGILSKNHNVLALSRNIRLLYKLKNAHPALDVLKCDITKEPDLIRVKAFIKKKFSYTDVLINNAGILYKQDFAGISRKELDETFDTNFYGVVRLIQHLLPFLKRSSAAHIVNIGSMGGFQGSVKFPGLSMYSASKAAIACLSECLAEEFKADRISVNCLALGSAQTEMLESAFPGFRAPLKAGEMAQFIAEFSTSGHKFFNGKVLPVAVSVP